MNKVKSYADACLLVGIDPNFLPDVSSWPEKDHKYLIACFKWDVIVRAYNAEWKADWSDWGQLKYYPWVSVKKAENSPSGFAFSHAAYYCADTVTYVGSRLCFSNSTDVINALATFPEIFIDIIIK